MYCFRLRCCQQHSVASLPIRFFRYSVRLSVASVVFRWIKLNWNTGGSWSRARFVGRGRRAQNKRSIPLESWRLGDSKNVIFFWKLTYALFWKCWFCKIWHLFRFACATGYGTRWIRANRIWNASSHLAQQRELGYEVVHRSVCRGRRI